MRAQHRSLETCDSSVWVLPNQLDPQISSLKATEKNSPVVLIESMDDFASRPQHKRKLGLALSAMRHFAEELRAEGWYVDYYALDDPCPTRCAAANGKYADCLNLHKKEFRPKTIRVTRPSEYDALKKVEAISGTLGTPVDITENNLFLTPIEKFKEWESSQSELVMENFYRLSRRNLNVLMEGDYPIGGRWNYDTDNRVPPMENMSFSSPPWVSPDEITAGVLRLVEEKFPTHPGTTNGFNLPVTRLDCRKWFDDFLENRLRLFGMYQDAMVRENPFMYHSILSPFMNIGLIHPLQVVRDVEKAYHNGVAPINSAEGFIRQIIGWREYVYGIYWSKMPEYRELNFFDHTAPVPRMFIDGKTRMTCLKDVVDQCNSMGYTHHIQRLMILGNFALLTGVSPQAFVEWFTSTHVDASDWGTVPNAMGMILFADGGYLSTKPYVASANYLGKMGNYCKDCWYKPRKRVGEKACPFNYLYWHFLKENESRLSKIVRMGMPYSVLRRKSDGEKSMIAKSAEDFLKRVHGFGSDLKIRR